MAEQFKGQLAEFTRQESQKSKSFKYWSVFLHNIVPVLHNLTHSFREKDWSLHLSVVQKAIPMFFSFDWTNYACWVPLYFDISLKLEEQFPLLYKKIMEEDLYVQQSRRASLHRGFIKITTHKTSIAK